MKIIDNNIHNALLKYRETFQTQRAMADALKLSPGQVGRLLHRRVSHFDDATWNRISPFLSPFIRPSIHCHSCIECPQGNNCLFKEIIENLLTVPNDRQREWFELINKFILENRSKYITKR